MEGGAEDAVEAMDARNDECVQGPSKVLVYFSTGVTKFVLERDEFVWKIQSTGARKIWRWNGSVKMSVDF